MRLSRSVQDYLKAVLELAGEDGYASTGDLAQRLGVAAPSVTGMLRRLRAARPALVAYAQQRGAPPTPSARPPDPRHGRPLATTAPCSPRPPECRPDRPHCRGP